MSFSEWIGFIISIGAFIFLMLKGRPKEEHENTLNDFLNSLKEDMSAKKRPAPAPSAPKVIKKKAFVPPPKPLIVSPHPKKKVEYRVIGKDRPSRAGRLLEALKNKRDMVILHEIIGPPKCKRR